MINHKHKFVFLHIPKTGGSSIGKALLKACGIKEDYESFYIHYDELTEEILKEYFVFTFVRNPWDRLVSSYRFQKNINSKVSFDSFLENTLTSFEKGYDTSLDNKNFNDFNFKDKSTYVGEFIHSLSQVDFLKGKYSHGINTLPYIDFIGRFENIEEDFNFIINKLRLNSNIEHNNKTNFSNVHYSWYYTNNIKSESLDIDAKQFNYSFDNIDQSNRVHYWFDDFKKFKPFDILSYNQVVNTYLEVSNKLKPDYDKEGWNERPINSDKEEIKEGENWDGFDPVYFNIDPTNEGIVMAKADTISMNMIGYKKSWTDFIYLTLPSQLITNYMTCVHDNEDISIAKKFIREVEEKYGHNSWKDKNWKTIEKEYDKKYSELSNYTDFYETHKCIKWKQDIDIAQYVSIFNNGLLFPICYNDKDFMLRRGTHRAFFLAMTGSDVPIILQYDKRKGNEQVFEVNTPEFFGGKSLKMIVDVKNKKQEYYIDNKKIKL